MRAALALTALEAAMSWFGNGVAVAAVFALLVTGANAQQPGHVGPVASGAPQGGGQGPQAREVGADVGSGWNILQIPAAAFAPQNHLVQWNFTDEGYRLFMDDTVTHVKGYWAPVFLPTGAGIGFLDLYAYVDNDVSTITATLRLLQGYGCRKDVFFPGCSLFEVPVPVTWIDLVSVSSLGDVGYHYVSSTQLNPLHTVNNNVLLGGGAQYVVKISYDAAPVLTHGFKGVDIWWKRQISPAPGAARFTDVPTNAQFFAEVEALAASGVTLGCTATTFCPDSPLTRRQMAAFLARALGLYWQY